MKIYTPGDREFEALIAVHAWFDHVLRAERGEILGDENGAPDNLNWLRQLPVDLELEIEETDGSLVGVAEDGSVTSIWEAYGPDDLPWCVFVVDQCGARLLPEYSVLDLDATDGPLDVILATGANEIPARYLEGDFLRTGDAVEIPDWVLHPVDRPDQD